MATLVTRFEELQAWQRARLLARQVHRVSSRGTFARDTSLREQCDRAAAATAANIASGFDRGGRSEFLQSLNLARGACAELRSHLYVAIDREHLDEIEFDNLLDLAVDVSKLITALRVTVARQGEAQSRDTAAPPPIPLAAAVEEPQEERRPQRATITRAPAPGPVRAAPDEPAAPEPAVEAIAVPVDPPAEESPTAVAPTRKPAAPRPSRARPKAAAAPDAEPAPEADPPATAAAAAAPDDAHAADAPEAPDPAATGAPDSESVEDMGPGTVGRDKPQGDIEAGSASGSP